MGNDLAGLHAIPLIDLHLGNATANPKRQVDLPDVDVALQYENTAFLRAKAESTAPNSGSNTGNQDTKQNCISMSHDSQSTVPVLE